MDERHLAEGGWSPIQTQPLEPQDVEALLRSDLSTDALPVFAPPVPESLGESLPCAMVERTGGTRLNPVMDAHYVTVCVWARTWAEATAAANRVAGAVVRLPDAPGASTQWRTAELTSLPYAAPDPNQPSIPRVQLTAALTCRATI